MKISIVTTITNPEERQDPYQEAIASYLKVADEVVVVNGGKDISLPFVDRVNPNIQFVNLPWPEEWSWEELPKHYNAGLAAATGDWVIKLDIDHIIHEEDAKRLRFLLILYKDKLVATFQKRNIILNGGFFHKAESFYGINKALVGDKIKFGLATDADTDLCRPINVLKDGELPQGSLIREKDCVRTGITVWNFDYTFKTKDVVAAEFSRMSRAYKRYFGETPWGETPKESFEIFLKGARKRSNAKLYDIKATDIIPSAMRKKYESLTEDQFGHSGWGLL